MAGELALVAIIIAVLAALFSTAASKRSDESPPDDGVRESRSRAEAAALAPDGRTLAWSGGGDTVRLWRLNAAGEQRELDPLALPPRSVPLAVAFSPDGTLLVAAGQECLAIWRCENGRFQPVVMQTGPTHRCLTFSPNGQTLALGNDDGSVSLCEMPAAREVMLVRAHQTAVRSVAFSPDGRRIVTSGQDRQVLLWDTQSGELLRQLSNPGPNPVQLVAFSPDGRCIAIGEFEPSARDVVLIDPENGEVRMRLRGQDTGTTALAFSPDGQTLASAGLDHSVKLWDLKSGLAETTISDGVGRVDSLTFSRDSALLAFAGADHCVRVWDMNRLKWSFLVGRTPLRA
jgi:WD40 repeat protein